MLATVENCGGQVEIDGLRELRTRSKCLRSKSHELSGNSNIGLCYAKAGPLIFVVKESLMTYPVFGHIMHGMKCIPMTRSNPIQDLKTLLKEGGEMLKNGVSVIIFPQKLEV